jgi:hypothetical protein
VVLLKNIGKDSLCISDDFAYDNLARQKNIFQHYVSCMIPR